MRHGIRVVCGLQFQPGALGVLFQQALAFQAATYTLTDQLNQILQLAFIRCFDALEPRWSVVAIAPGAGPGSRLFVTRVRIGIKLAVTENKRLRNITQT